MIAGYPWPVPCASSPIIESHAEGVEHIARRLATEYAEMLDEGRRLKVNTTGGEYKSMYLPVRVRTVDRVVWFARGQAKEVRRICRSFQAIGHKSAYGYGRVAQWDVEFVEHDWSWWATSPSGPVLMRPLPACAPIPDGAIGYRSAYHGIRGPYWSMATMGDAIVPC